MTFKPIYWFRGRGESWFLNVHRNWQYWRCVVNTMTTTRWHYPVYRWHAHPVKKGVASRTLPPRGTSMFLVMTALFAGQREKAGLDGWSQYREIAQGEEGWRLFYQQGSFQGLNEFYPPNNLFHPEGSEQLQQRGWFQLTKKGSLGKSPWRHFHAQKVLFSHEAAPRNPLSKMCDRAWQMQKRPLSPREHSHNPASAPCSTLYSSCHIIYANAMWLSPSSGYATYKGLWVLMLSS